MRVKSKILLVIVLCSVLRQASAQNFINPSLESPDSTTALPSPWEAVSADDSVCLATYLNFSDTPNPTFVNFPSPTTGVAGIPNSGNSFISGLLLDNESSTQGHIVYQEGIKQTIYGLTPHCEYEIAFFQSVVKQKTALDSSGSWAIYMDNTLIGISSPTTSLLAFDNTLLTWEERKVYFNATADTHTIKFLPYDDDLDQSLYDGALRMGIDDITLSCYSIIDMPNVFTPNNDGVNDNFKPIRLLNIKKFTLSIFNRWGELVNNKSNHTNNWDGLFKNNLCSEGTYYWRIQYIDSYGNSGVKHGTVTLIR